MAMSFPKAIQVLRDSGGVARRSTWGLEEGVTLEPAPWSGGQVEMLLRRTTTGREHKPSVGLYVVTGDDVRGLDWHVQLPAQPQEKADGPPGSDDAQHPG